MSTGNYQDCIMFNLAKAYQRVHGEFKASFSKFGLTPMQLLVLEALFQEEGLSAGEIGKRLVLDSATLSGVIDRMIEAGWIVKQVSGRDRRRLEISLTPKARDLEEILLNRVDELNAEFMKPLGLEERLLLMRFLKDLRA